MRGNRYGRRNQYGRGSFSYRSNNQPVMNMANKYSRRQFIQTAGVGAAAVGAAAYGMSGAGTVSAQPVPQDYAQAEYMGKNILYHEITNGHWFDQVPGDRYGNCAWILSAMCVPDDFIEWPVEYGFNDYDIFGGPLMDCIDYAVYTCKSAAGCETRFLESTDENQRRATCWFNNGTKTVQLNVPGTPGVNCYQLAVYVLDKDSTVRTEAITVRDGSTTSGPVAVSTFENGRYLKFQVNAGTVYVDIAHTGGGANAVISGLFLDPLTCGGIIPVTHLGDDNATQGDWVGNYGSSWYLLCSWNHPINVTSDGSVLVNEGGVGHYAWTSACTQGSGVCNVLEQDKGKADSFAWSWGNQYPESALKVPPQAQYPQVCDQVAGASTWASTYDDGGEKFPQGGPDMYVDLHLPEMGECEGTGCYYVSFYAYDPDSDCRRQIFEVYDPETGDLLTRSEVEGTSDWDYGYVGEGVYHTFYLPAGDYLVKVDYIGCTNAILSGIFVECAPCRPVCGRTIGYWKNHDWEGMVVDICGVGVDETLGKGYKTWKTRQRKTDTILWNANSRNFSMLVAQLLGALLNTYGYSDYNVNPEGSPVWISEIKEWLCQQLNMGMTDWWNTPFSSKEQKDQAVQYYQILDNFNNYNPCDQECEEGIIYGTSLGGPGVGDIIYKIDLSAMTAEALYDTEMSPSSVNGPNGNAYDQVYNRLYFTEYKSPDKLWYYDFNTDPEPPLHKHEAGQITGVGLVPNGSVACGAWYNGDYYYIRQGGNKLFKVTLNPADGTIVGSPQLVYTLTSGSFGSFGDIVIDQNTGILYGSSGAYEYWKIDLGGPDSGPLNKILTNTLPGHVQLAFSSDGVLYAHQAGTGNFYRITDPNTGVATPIGTVNYPTGGPMKFTDLASGPVCP
jgi:hypothetical protein